MKNDVSMRSLLLTKRTKTAGRLFGILACRSATALRLSILLPHIFQIKNNVLMQSSPQKVRIASNRIEGILWPASARHIEAQLIRVICIPNALSTYNSNIINKRAMVKYLSWKTTVQLQMANQTRSIPKTPKRESLSIYSCLLTTR